MSHFVILWVDWVTYMIHSWSFDIYCSWWKFMGHFSLWCLDCWKKIFFPGVIQRNSNCYCRYFFCILSILICCYFALNNYYNIIRGSKSFRTRIAFGKNKLVTNLVTNLLLVGSPTIRWTTPTYERVLYRFSKSCTLLLSYKKSFLNSCWNKCLKKI